MKKKRIIFIVIIILIILIIPIKFKYEDGGTIEYKSLTYKIIKWHKLDNYYDSGYKTGTEMHLFPNNFKPIGYYEEVKPPRFGLTYKDKLYYSQVLSYSWSNEYNSVCADSIGLFEIDYKEVIEAEKNETMHYAPSLKITSIKLYDEKEIIDYDVEFDNENEIVKIPNLEGIYIMEFYYRCSSGYVSYAFKLNIK